VQEMQSIKTIFDMSTYEELELLIKSKYPVIYLESIDELHTIKQLHLLANRLNLVFYQWSLTEGLKKEYNRDSYYETKQPLKMLNQFICPEGFSKTSGRRHDIETFQGQHQPLQEHKKYLRNTFRGI
jgi:hypothetical protein